MCLSCLLFFPFEDSKSFGQSEASAIDLDIGITCLELLGYALQLLLGLRLDEFLRASWRLSSGNCKFQQQQQQQHQHQKQKQQTQQ